MQSIQHLQQARFRIALLSGEPNAVSDFIRAKHAVLQAYRNGEPTGSSNVRGTGGLAPFR